MDNQIEFNRDKHFDEIKCPFCVDESGSGNDCEFCSGGRSLNFEETIIKRGFIGLMYFFCKP